MSISDTNIAIVLCTVPNKIIAQKLATKVLSERLAACITFLSGVTSLYYWKGKLEKKHEIQMLLKTNLIHQQALLDYLKLHHPYQIPELLVLPTIYCDSDYHSWISTSLN